MVGNYLFIGRYNYDGLCKVIAVYQHNGSQDHCITSGVICADVAHH